jgi:hypothetical protein
MTIRSVSDWLAELRRNDELRYHLVDEVRQLALRAGPTITEQVKYGGILFADSRGFCGLFSYTNHVTLEFGEGASLPDPHRQLEGKGKGRRHIKLTAIADIEAKHVQDYIALAYAASLASAGA